MTAPLFLKVTVRLFGLGTVRLSMSRVTRTVQGPHVTQAFQSPTKGSRGGRPGLSPLSRSLWVCLLRDGR